ncbi:MAG: hypothetical protein ACEY3E_03675 [Candidatus Tisiphia sp.]
MKYDIIKKAVVLLGSNVGISSIGGGRISKAEDYVRSLLILLLKILC